MKNKEKNVMNIIYPCLMHLNKRKRKKKKRSISNKISNNTMKQKKNKIGRII